jgi:ABC-2 family transporter
MACRPNAKACSSPSLPTRCSNRRCDRFQCGGRSAARSEWRLITAATTGSSSGATAGPRCPRKIRPRQTRRDRFRKSAEPSRAAARRAGGDRAGRATSRRPAHRPGSQAPPLEGPESGRGHVPIRPRQQASSSGGPAPPSRQGLGRRRARRRPARRRLRGGADQRPARGWRGLPPSAPETVALVVGSFVLGFGFYSAAYAALGAFVSRQEDLDATAAPVNVLLIGAYLGVNAAIQNANGTRAQITAFLPPTSPMIAPTRVVLGDMARSAPRRRHDRAARHLPPDPSRGGHLRALDPAHRCAHQPADSARHGRRTDRARPHPHPSHRAAGQRGHRPSERVIAGTGKPLGIALVATGLLLVVLYQYGRHRRSTPHG